MGLMGGECLKYGSVLVYRIRLLFIELLLLGWMGGEFLNVFEIIIMF